MYYITTIHNSRSGNYKYKILATCEAEVEVPPLLIKHLHPSGTVFCRNGNDGSKHCFAHFIEDRKSVV